MADLREEQAVGRSLIHQVARAHDLTIDDLTGRNRSRPVVTARQEAMAVVQAQTSLSLPQLGVLFGGRDHTTIMHGIRRHEQRRQGSRTPAAPLAVTSKRCSRCGDTKPAADFHRHNRPTGDGLQGYCRSCATESKRTREGTTRRRRHGADVRQTSMQIDRKLYDALLATAEEFGLTRSELIDGAIRRELRRLWTSCRRCGSGRRVEGSELCGRCVATGLRGRVAS